MWSWFLARLKGIFNWIASIIIFFVLLAVVGGIIGMFTQPKLPGEVVLTLDMRDGLPDQGRNNPFAGQQHRVASIIDAVTALAKAESDDKVKGLYMRVGGGGISSSAAQELRAAIKSFKAKGKFVFAHAQAFYTAGMGDYLLASAADEIWLQPVSEMKTAGVSSTSVFLRNMLDKIGTKPEFAQRYEYKNAANMFMEKDFTPAHREASTRLIESVFESATAEIAASRKKTRDEVVALVNAAPYLTQQAIDKKLIDKQGYDDEAEDAALARAGGKAELKSLSDYYKLAGSPWEGIGRPTIAFIQGDGQINDGESESDFGGDTSMGGDTIAQAFRDATDDENVKAILFRVNSPGGSALASDQILDAVKKAQKAGKKVVVSMADVAASGGYYVSLSADKIFAHETTITGSIGVLSGKLVTVGSWAMLGIDLKSISVGTNALMDASTQSFTPEQWAAFNRGIDQIYEDFTAKVAAGRKMPVEKIREIAKGRVWTGADAKARGLVDEFGGFRAALEATKAMAGIPADADINLQRFPGPKNPFDEIAEMFGTTAEMARTMVMLGKVMESEPVAQVSRILVDDAKQSRSPQMLMPRHKTN
ncbi:MAG: signal peptide peptidase SppA [Micropepsaceae bacterium]